jgi:hypothetical protein
MYHTTLGHHDYTEVQTEPKISDTGYGQTIIYSRKECVVRDQGRQEGEI